MYCSQCGKELKEDDKFCSNCGKEIETQNEHTEAKIKQSELKEADESGKDLLSVIIISVVVILAIILSIGIGYTIMNSDRSELSGIGDVLLDIFTNKATADDVEIDSEILPTGLAEASVQVVLQANEKIKNLTIEVSLYDSENKIVKIEEIYFGKVAPGNKYKEYISLSGFSLSEILDIDKIGYKILEGTVIK